MCCCFLASSTPVNCFPLFPKCALGASATKLLDKLFISANIQVFRLLHSSKVDQIIISVDSPSPTCAENNFFPSSFCLNLALCTDFLSITTSCRNRHWKHVKKAQEFYVTLCVVSLTHLKHLVWQRSNSRNSVLVSFFIVNSAEQKVSSYRFIEL